jgi:hypothetical protein
MLKISVKPENMKKPIGGYLPIGGRVFMAK